MFAPRHFLLAAAILAGGAASSPAASGDDPRRVTADGWTASFSPDGKRLVVGRLPGGLDIIDLATLARTPLTRTGTDPAWSPDGRLIAFVDRENDDRFADTVVFLVGADGKGLRPLTRGRSPVWMSDGKGLYFTSRTQGQVLTIAVDDPRARPRVFFEDPAIKSQIFIDPTGDRLAYTNFGSLIIVDTSTRATVNTWLGWGKGDFLAAWSPDGKLLAYGETHWTGDGLWTYQIDNASRKRVITGSFTLPVWSRDGTLLAFHLKRGDSREVWAMPVPHDLRPKPAGTRAPPANAEQWHPRDLDLSALSGPDRDRRVWTLGDLEGKLLLVNVWSKTCKPAVDLLPVLDELHAGARDFQVLTLNVDRNANAAHRFAMAMGLQVPVIAARRYLERHGLDLPVPRTWIVAPGGRVLAERRGYDRQQRQEWIDTTLTELRRLQPAANASLR